MAADLTDPATFLDPVTGSWRCISCGSCCRQVPLFAELRDQGFDRGDGVCIKLTEEGLCSIYEDRPSCCRVPPDLAPMRAARACAFVNKLGVVSEVRYRADVRIGLAHAR